MPLSAPGSGEPIVKRANVAVAAALRLGIIRGDLAPGEAILEEDVADTLGVSRTPVREALLLLAGERLVDLGNVRGQRAVVRDMSTDELDEIYAMRAMLEGYVARKAAERVTPALLRQLEQSITRMSKLAGNVHELIEENHRFHTAILTASSTDRLAFIVENLLQIPLEYKRDFWLDASCLEVDIQGHRDVLAALRDEDAAAAEAAMAKHLHDVGVLTLSKRTVPV
ncbi:DNA-binding GntR family transcriptional regulator [Microbacterium sp. BE35]|uniref:GntR family transcriptional regulator n=1 Tax=Microbacterium sp. BE35 TaxID=2817773 RepID=UPI002857A2FE|nr:GntR family transcriptional regulator [Microbacterium sp. BE35]MDR7188222.1 DNA-binding GntR family transcriptional regulator [Microbacterium sp. BE35]